MQEAYLSGAYQGLCGRTCFSVRLDDEDYVGLSANLGCQGVGGGEEEGVASNRRQLLRSSRVAF